MAITKQILETGIDKLLKLIQSSGKISVAEAAKELEVGKKVIMGWAESFEEEGLISFEHRFLNTFLTLRDMTKKEVEVKSKELNGKKDIIIRKAQGTLYYFSKEKEKFKEVVKEFSKLKRIVYKNKSLKNELQEFKKYKQMKDDLDEEAKKARYNLTTLKIHREKFNSQVRKERENIKFLIKATREQKKKVIKNEKLKRDLIKYLGYINRKMKTVDIILNMDNNRKELRNELAELLRRTKALEISSQNGNSGKDMGDIEKKFGHINNKKVMLEEEHKRITKIPILEVFRN